MSLGCRYFSTSVTMTSLLSGGKPKPYVAAKVRVDELIQGASTCKKMCALSGSIASEASLKNLKTLKKSPLGSPRWLPGGGEGNDLNGNWVMASRSYQDLQVGGAFP
ncbi:hypothetical protein TNCT_159261 [Trichonephila clavata]|uniref:Uncharacterized protein n=1 Tax=Trichonephila clavata TaxID=2740835 RepID=A0A8X6LK55_TRICU|nr:hypothetical protein TNCT_159261 [Trichonephila clavata]